MNKKTQIAILIATLTMQAQSMVDIKPITVKFDDFKTEYPFFRFKEAKRYSNDECRIGKISLKNNIPANSVVNLVIPARTKKGYNVVLNQRACSGLNNENIKINLFLFKKRKSHQQGYDYVKIVGDKSGFFQGSSSLVLIDMRGIDSKNAKCVKKGWKKHSHRNKYLMTSMFEGCTRVKSIRWGKFNASKVTRMDCLFKDCKSLENLNLNLLNTSRVRTMREMLANCYQLKHFDMSLCSVANVQNMEKMFLNCYSLSCVNLKNYDMGEVQTMQSMFEGCESIKSITLPFSDIQKLTTMQSMFQNCQELEKLDFSDVKIPLSTMMADFISGCQNLEMISFYTNMPSEKFVNAIAGCKDCPRFTATLHNLFIKAD
jgi:surface protein